MGSAWVCACGRGLGGVEVGSARDQTDPADSFLSSLLAALCFMAGWRAGLHRCLHGCSIPRLRADAHGPVLSSPCQACSGGCTACAPPLSLLHLSSTHCRPLCIPMTPGSPSKAPQHLHSSRVFLMGISRPRATRPNLGHIFASLSLVLAPLYSPSGRSIVLCNQCIRADLARTDEPRVVHPCQTSLNFSWPLVCQKRERRLQD